MKKMSFLVLLVVLVAGLGFGQGKLTVLCGVTMRYAIEELSSNFTKATGTKFEISYGGSGDLQKLIQANKVGDIFFPGTDTFIKTLQGTGEVVETAFAGENKAVLVVAKGNPKGIKTTKDLTSPKLNIVLAKASSGSIGKESEKILTAAGINDTVSDNVLFFTTDSKDLVSAIKSGEADATINWKAAASLAENKPHMDVIDIPGANAERLVFGLLKYSKNAEVAKKFIQYATSAEGKGIFDKHGF